MKKTYEQASIEIMAEDGVDRVWFGDPDLWHGIFERKNGHNNAHPMDQWKAVYSALKRSRLFELQGYLWAPGFTTSRETAHPVFGLKNSRKAAQKGCHTSED